MKHQESNLASIVIMVNTLYLLQRWHIFDKPWKAKSFLQFEIIVYVLVSCFRFFLKVSESDV